ncbi:MAG: DUF6198 family protein [Firmicutes bacterium]|nr:DUF6198 family protein [Bacillota bacterium]
MKIKLILRYIIFLIGIFMMGLGISMTAKTGLGTTPISSVPLLLSRIFPLSFGTMAFLLSLVFIIIEWLILREDFTKEHYAQIIVTPFFGYFIDLGMLIFKNLKPETYLDNIIVLLIACILISFGISLQVIARVLINSAEGLVKVMADKTRCKFGNIKILFDSSLILIALVISLLAFRKVKDVREGTIIVAIALGSLTKVFLKFFDWLGIDWLYE